MLLLLLCRGRGRTGWRGGCRAPSTKSPATPKAAAAAAAAARGWASKGSHARPPRCNRSARRRARGAAAACSAPAREGCAPRPLAHDRSRWPAESATVHPVWSAEPAGRILLPGCELFTPMVLVCCRRRRGRRAAVRWEEASPAAARQPAGSSQGWPLARPLAPASKPPSVSKDWPSLPARTSSPCERVLI